RISLRVVFDGEPEKHFADGAVYRGVRVFYAERGSNADERIKQFVEKERERRTLIVVTSDRALADYVRRCGAQVMRSGEFRRRMEEALSESQASHEEAEAAGEDLNQWMRYFGVGPEDE
ncbi:MAG: NYN domain-containing protein, partial [Pyrinomonadaceae bacterium]